MTAVVTHKRGRYSRLNCQQCGNEFDASRFDAKYCTPTCRKAAHRRAEKAADMAVMAVSQIIGIKKLMAEYPDDARVSAAGALALETITRALSVTIARVTEPARINSVTTAGTTEKLICPKCGRTADYISIFTNECDACLRGR